MKLRVQAKRAVSRVTSDRPVRITVRVRSLQVNAAMPLARGPFTEGVVDGVAQQLTRNIERIGRCTSGLPDSVPVSVPAISMRSPISLNFKSGNKVGESCASAVATLLTGG